MFCGRKRATNAIRCCILERSLFGHMVSCVSWHFVFFSMLNGAVVTHLFPIGFSEHVDLYTPPNIKLHTLYLFNIN